MWTVQLDRNNALFICSSTIRHDSSSNTILDTIYQSNLDRCSLICIQPRITRSLWRCVFIFTVIDMRSITDHISWNFSRLGAAFSTSPSCTLSYLPGCFINENQNLFMIIDALIFTWEYISGRWLTYLSNCRYPSTYYFGHNFLPGRLACMIEENLKSIFHFSCFSNSALDQFVL